MLYKIVQKEKRLKKVTFRTWARRSSMRGRITHHKVFGKRVSEADIGKDRQVGKVCALFLICLAALSLVLDVYMGYDDSTTCL